MRVSQYIDRPGERSKFHRHSDCVRTNAHEGPIRRTNARYIARAASSPRLPTPLNSPSCVYAQLKGSSTNPAAVNQRPTMLSGSGSGSDWPGKRKPRDDPCAPAPDRRSVASRKPRSIPDAWQSRGATVACYYALRRHAWEGASHLWGICRAVAVAATKKAACRWRHLGSYS